MLLHTMKFVRRKLKITHVMLPGMWLYIVNVFNFRCLAVPAAASDNDLREVAKFRSKNRLPVLSWMHPDSLATISRSAQPLVGMANNRSEADEKYMQSIMDANAQRYALTYDLFSKYLT